MSPLPSKQNPEVFPGSNRLIEGELPPQTILLIGQSGIGKTIFCKQFAYNGLMRGETCVYVATDESPDEIQKSMKHFGLDIESSKENTKFRIIDCYSWKLGGRRSGEFFVNNPSDLSLVSSKIEHAMEDLNKITLVLDSLTGLTSICSHHLTYFSKFLQTIVAKLRTTQSNAVFTIAPEAHDQQFLSFIRLAFDGTLEMKLDESGREIKRLLRVFSLKGACHKTNWTPFEITNQGISIISEGKQRCVMCSGLIEWKPIVEIIEGKEYHFDSKDCAETYKKLKSLYGPYFE